MIKEIDVDGLPESKQLEAFIEIETLQLCDSNYIVGYIDSFLDGSKINIVLEYCPVGDLCCLIIEQKKLSKGNHLKPFADNVIWKIFINLCLGCQYLHSKNIIHRDLKTLNVFMMKDHFAKIGDLGCAMTLSDETLEVIKEEEKK